MPRRKSDPVERFWSKVDKSGECWLWTDACFGDGYGMFGLARGDTRRAHRFAYELSHGPIPAGLVVMHACDTPRCCRPDHLSVGSADDNTADMVGKGRQHRRLSDDDVRAIRASSELHSELAARYGVSEPTISLVRSGRSYAQLLPPDFVRPARPHHAHKLAAADVADIRARHAAGERQVDIAARYGIRQTMVSNIVRRTAWAHVE